MPDFEVARGEHVGAVEPGSDFNPRLALTWDEFVKAVTTFEHRSEKDGPYFCRPMLGSGHRTDANAGNWPLLPVDLDELQPEDSKFLHEWCEKSGLSVVLATTFSHSPDAPRMRLWIRCSRDVTKEEHPFLHMAFAPAIPFKLDPAVRKLSQPIFLPACPPQRSSHAFARAYEGKAMDVDRMLEGYRDLIAQRSRERAEGAKGIKTGVRVAGGTIDLFNQNFDLRDLLENSGSYVRRSRNRYMYKGSKSKRAAVVVYTDGPEHVMVSFHENDPLAVKNAEGQPRMLDPFAAYAILEHNNDFKAAFEGARRWVNERGLDGKPKDESAPKPLIILTLDQISENLLPRESVIQGLLERGCVTLATGDSNSGKTTVLQYQSLCIAQGIPFASHPTTRSKVLWVAGEDAYNAQIRYLALAQRFGISHKDLKDWLFILPQRIEIMREESLHLFQEAIAQTLPQHDNIGAIYLDSKSMVWGGEDENSNDEAARFIQVLNEEVAVPYRAAVIVTHHLTKFKEKAQQTARGAGALINNIDHEWRFDKKGNDRIVTMEPGSKLRIAPWTPKHFFIEIYSLDTTDHPHLIDNFGESPKISIPQLVNASGVAVGNLEEDLEQSIIIAVMQMPGCTTKQGKVILRRVAKEVLEHPSADSIRKKRAASSGNGQAENAEEAAELWVKNYQDKLRRTVLPKMVEKKLLDEEFLPTDAGKKFSLETLGPVGDEPPVEEDPESPVSD